MHITHITNGRIFFNGEFTEKEILVQDGKIAKIANSISSSTMSLASAEGEKIDARGLIVLPGLIDLHVHLREPGFEHKEDFNTGGKAAVAGGIVHMFDMPNNKVPATTAELLKKKIELAQNKNKRNKSTCKIGFYLGATTGNELEWKKLDKELDFVGLKIYMGQTTGDLIVGNEKALDAHFSLFDSKRPIVVHAEDQKTIEKEGRTQGAALAAVENATRLGKKYSKKLHIAHVSTGAEVELVGKIYPKTTVETCPHYLFINQKELDSLGYLGGVNPPVRDNKTRQELWAHLADIDCISTDHAPHTLEDKKNGAKGYPGLETSLALMLDAYSRKLIRLDDVPKMMSENPAKIIGLKQNGEIKEGMNADFTIVDLRKEWVVRGEELETKCKWSPFEGRKLRGKNVKTIIDGKLVFEDGAIV